MRVGKIILRRDVHDDEPLHTLRMTARQQHRNFPSHAVPHQRHPLQVKRVHPRQHVGHHDIVGHFGCMRRLAVIAKIERQHMIIRRQIAARRQPVARRPEKSMQHHQRRIARPAQIAMKEINHAS